MSKYLCEDCKFNREDYCSKFMIANNLKNIKECIDKEPIKMVKGLCEKCLYGDRESCVSTGLNVETLNGKIIKCNNFDKYDLSREKCAEESTPIGDKINKVDEHMKLCKELNKIYAAKNHDYGDSFKKVRDELGDVAILVRLYDKLGRLKTLLTGATAKVKDESIEDNLKDLANYALMELIERECDKND